MSQNYQINFDVVIHMGKGLFRGSATAPSQRGRSPSAIQFVGFSSIYDYTL